MNKRTLMLCSSPHKDICLAEWNAFPPNLPVISSGPGSPEFFMSPETFPDGSFPPPTWASPAEGTSAAVSATEQAWSEATNPESWQPPLYYAIAGLWLKLGQLCGFSDGHLLYWLRFLNVFFLAALVWPTFLAAREFFPQQEWVAVCIPVLVAFIPQDMFYGIKNDNLSPLLFGAVFICLLAGEQSRSAEPSAGGLCSD